MPLPQLPLFSDDMIEVSKYIALKKQGDTVFWFQGNLPVFCHHVRDQKSFRLFCCQLINIGNATSAEIARALKVNPEKLSRWAREARAESDDEASLSASESSCKKKKVSCINS
jgi:hypothetical protein